MNDGEIDTSRCPLCGDENACGMAAGRDECWCFEVVLAPDALARVPERARGVACICARCGRAGRAGAAD